MALLRFTSSGAKTATGPIPKFSIAWDAGVHVIVKCPDGSPTALFGVIAGTTPARGCVTTLGEGVSWTSFAHVPSAIAWPQDLSVGEALRIAATARGTLASVNFLDTFSLEHLSDVCLRDVDPPTVRAIALLEALLSPSVRVLLLDEGQLDGRVAPDLDALLHERAAAGVAIIAAKSETGAMTKPTSEVLLREQTTGVVRIDTDDVDALAVALAQHSGLRMLRSSPRTLWIDSATPETTLQIAHSAIAQSGIAVDRLEVVQ